VWWKKGTNRITVIRGFEEVKVERYFHTLIVLVYRQRKWMNLETLNGSVNPVIRLRRKRGKWPDLAKFSSFL
jgi:hypothetical protein